MDVQAYLEDKGFSPTRVGDNWNIDCPWCDDTRSRLGVHMETGQWNCFNCDARGKTIKSFAKKLDNTSVEDLELKPPKDKTPVKIDQTLAAKYVSKLERDDRKALTYLQKDRGFSKKTIEHFQLGSWKTNGFEYVSIPFWKRGQLVNMKFRAINFTDKKWKWRRIKGGESVLFHDDVLDDKQWDHVFICEAELDCISLFNAGMKNVIAATTGAKGMRGFKQEWFDRLERFKKIYIVYDNDVDGQAGAEKMANRLGFDRCLNVRLPQGIKDVNQYFWDDQKKEARFDLDAFKKLVKDARKFEVRDTVSLRDAIKDLHKDLFLADEDELIGLTTPWKRINKIMGGAKPGHLIVTSAPPKIGKCHPKGTQILMFDGSFKNVEDLRVGNLVMGPDSKPRKVLSLGKGKERMFQVVPKFGDVWGCNESHVLSLIACRTTERWKAGQVVNMTVKEYLGLSKWKRERLSLWRAAVEFAATDLEFDPYWVGLWLGDGTVGETHISKPVNLSVLRFFKKFAKENGLVHSERIYNGGTACPRHTFTVSGNTSLNPLKRFVKTLVFDSEKRIPKNYLINSMENRQKLLAGLLDSDGHVSDSGTCEFVTKFAGLRDDFLFLARSVGFRTSVRSKFVGGVEYFRIFLGGDLSKLPLKQRKTRFKKKRNPLMSSFKLRDVGFGTYYGFELDGDHLYLLKDFTVTHNTTWVLNWCLHLGRDEIPTYIYECEMKPKRMAEKYVAMHCKDFSSADDITEIQLAEARYGLPTDHIYFGYPQQDQLTLDNVCDRMKEAVQRYGIKMVVFDNLHFLVRGGQGDVKDQIGQVTRRFKLLAETLNIVFVLIVHPRKVNGKLMTADDLKDSSSIYQDLDTLVILHRNPKAKSTDAVEDDEDGGAMGSYDELTDVHISGRWCEGGRTSLYFEGKRALFHEQGSLYMNAIKKRSDHFNKMKKQRQERRRK